MTIQVFHAEDADISRMFEIFSLAFSTREPFCNAWYTKHWTPEGRQAGAKRMLQDKTTDSYGHYLKAVDSSTGEIVGMSKWMIYDNVVPDFAAQLSRDPGDHWIDPEQKACAIYLSRQIFAENREAVLVSNGNLVALRTLAVDPAHQRKGVGAALVEWGTRRADEMGVEAVVESSAFGKGLYEKHGFAYTKQITIHVPEKWKQWDGQGFAWLVRPKRA